MIIYKATNLKNGKVYIGQTINSLECRMNQHFRDTKRTNRSLTYFHNAINKYGKDNFKFEVIDTANDIDDLNEKELYWINKYNSTNKDIGYNLDFGGRNSLKSESTKKIIGEKTKERWNDPEIANRMLNGLKMGNETQKNKPKQRVKFVCEICGKELYLLPFEAKNKKYCSAKCSGIAFANNKETQEKIKVSLKNRDNKYKENVVNTSIGWCLDNKEKILNCSFNKISPVLNPLLNILNIKDYRTLSRCFNTKSRKELLNKFKNIVCNY